MAHFVTFYSWKGGVGRTMALANVAVQLARRGRRVLMVDWDLEAPGLNRYFEKAMKNGESLISVKKAANSTGLLGLLSDAMKQTPLKPAKWKSRLLEITVPPAKKTYSNAAPPTPAPLHFLPSGYGKSGYSTRLAEFSLEAFYANANGDIWFETLREQWKSSYDFVLIDSRTGLTDSGGICTIHFPDWLVLVFTSNDQSLEGGMKIVEAAQVARRNYQRDRAPLMVIPLLSRWDGDSEVDLAESWMERLDNDLKPLTDAWLPTAFTPRQYLERTRVPHVARFSFGEPLPVLTHSVTDPALPGLAYENLAGMLDSGLTAAGRIIDREYSPRDEYLRRSLNNLLRELAIEAGPFRDGARHILVSAKRAISSARRSLAERSTEAQEKLEIIIGEIETKVFGGLEAAATAANEEVAEALLMNGVLPIVKNLIGQLEMPG